MNRPQNDRPVIQIARVFISYAREDLEFVRRLDHALRAAGRETWIDLEGIPLSADWLREINEAIEFM